MRLRRRLMAITASAAVIAAVAAPMASARADSQPVPDDAPVTGYDVSYPQCGAALPGGGSFVIVGVNGGRVLAPNPCLAEQTAWAYRTDDRSYYANTANPGPLLSAHWPSGQRFPRVCASDYPANDSEGCSYDYGWTAAEDSYGDAYSAALETYGEGAAEPKGDWWLDVEAANSWETLADGPTPPAQAQANAVAGLQGAVDYLTTVATVRQVGFYSNPTDWYQITGGTLGRFADKPVWVAGAGDRASAEARCDPSNSFTGGEVQLAQYREGAFDADVRCPATGQPES